MCVYSLEYIASRLAAVADRLISTRFNNNTSTRGFAGVDDVNTAGCLRQKRSLRSQRGPYLKTRSRIRKPSHQARWRRFGRSISMCPTPTMTR